MSGAIRALRPLKPSGLIPITVNGCPLMKSVLPTKSGRPPIRFQKTWLTTTTGMFAFGRHSSAL